MNKKRSPKEIIEEESSKDATKEHAFLKFPGKELIPATAKSEENKAEVDKSERERLEKIYGGKRSILHTHQYDPDTTMIMKGKKTGKVLVNKRVSPDIPLPSDQDLGGFLNDPRAKSAYIAQYNSKTGNVEGYFVMRKTSKTPAAGMSHLEKYADERAKGEKGSMVKTFYHIGRALISLSGIKKKMDRYGREISEGVISDNPEKVKYVLDKITNKYHLKYRLIPAEGYAASHYKTHFVKKVGGKKRLEEEVAGTAAIIGLAGSILFSSLNITGNAIADLSTKTNSFLGAVLLVIGLIGSFFWFRSRKC